MTSLNKKAVMGIGTLIIFIATILVAAVAAAVLISTSNVLQQRSLLVGQDARKSITDGVEVVSIMAVSDPSAESFNQFEVMMRLSPGSDALQMRRFNLQYIGPSFDEGAVLAFAPNASSSDPGVVDSITYAPLYDLDGDGLIDSITLILDAFGSNEALRINLSNNGASDLIALDVDLSAAGTTPVFVDLPQKGVYIGEEYFGVVSVNGMTSTDNELDASLDVIVTEFVNASDCAFDALPYQGYYCYYVVNGNDDFVLSSGERYKIFYQLSTPNLLTVGEDFQLIFTTDKGRLSEARARTPDVITSTKTKLWPLG